MQTSGTGPGDLTQQPWRGVESSVHEFSIPTKHAHKQTRSKDTLKFVGRVMSLVGLRACDPDGIKD
jgi:hypothetical protein